MSESGFFILLGVSSYFETINQFLTGEDSEGKSRPFFVAGFRAVYPSSPLNDLEIENLYKVLRCGMYHSSMPKGYTVLDRNEPQAIRKEAQEIVINPALLVRDIQAHFEKYVADLKVETNAAIRANFDKRAEEIERSITVPVQVSGSATPTMTTPPPMMSGQQLLPPWKIE
jgi:hypothetical protein